MINDSIKRISQKDSTKEYYLFWEPYLDQCYSLYNFIPLDSNSVNITSKINNYQRVRFIDLFNSSINYDKQTF